MYLQRSALLERLSVRRLSCFCDVGATYPLFALFMPFFLLLYAGYVSFYTVYMLF